MQLATFSAFCGELEKISNRVPTPLEAQIVELTTPEQKQQARALETSVFRGPTADTHHRIFGIYSEDKLVAMTRVNTQPLDKLRGPMNEKLRALHPEVGISSTVVHPKHRGKGYATALKKHLISQYSSILTGTSHKSHPSMAHINENLGFKVIPETRRGKSVLYHWKKAELVPKELLGLNKAATVILRSKLAPPLKVPLERGDLAEFRKREAMVKGKAPGDCCSLGRDKDGYYCYTHRARSKSYARPSQIPLDRIRFVGSTA